MAPPPFGRAGVGPQSAWHSPPIVRKKGDPPVRMALPSHRRGGAGVGSVTKFIPLYPISQRDLSHLSEKTQPQPPQCHSTLTAIDEKT